MTFDFMKPDEVGVVGRPSKQTVVTALLFAVLAVASVDVGGRVLLDTAAAEDTDFCLALSEALGRDRVFCSPQEYLRAQGGSFGLGNRFCEDAGSEVAAVARPKDAEAVAAAVRVATAFGVRVAPRSGGHSYSCASFIPGGLHIDLRDLDTVELRKRREGENSPPEYQESGWLATVGTGNTFEKILAKIDRERFSFVHGECLTVGVGGFFLHGGAHGGALSGMYGYGSEQLEHIEVVLADGSLRSLDWHTAPRDLWHALTAAGSNFGIVTSLTFRVYERPEPEVFFYHADITYEEAWEVFEAASHDPLWQVNVFNYMLPGVTLQVAYLGEGDNSFSDSPEGQRARADQWLADQGVPVTWSFQWVIDNVMRLQGRWDYGQVYPGAAKTGMLRWRKHEAWATSSIITPMSSGHARSVFLAYMKEADKHQPGSLARTLGRTECWTAANQVPYKQGRVPHEQTGVLYTDQTCVPAAKHNARFKELEAGFENLAQNRDGAFESESDEQFTFHKYVNVPFVDGDAKREGELLWRYYHALEDLAKAKTKYDPNDVFGPAKQRVPLLKDLPPRPADYEEPTPRPAPSTPTTTTPSAAAPPGLHTPVPAATTTSSEEAAEGEQTPRPTPLPAVVLPAGVAVSS